MFIPSKNVTIIHRLKDLVRYFYYFLFNSRHRFNIKRYQICKVKKPFLLRLSERFELWKYWGVMPMHYYTHDFYKADCPLSIEQMKSYIPSYYFYNIIYPRFDNLYRNSDVLSDKILSSIFFKGLGYTIPKVLLIKKGNSSFDINGYLIKNEQIVNCFSRSFANKIFIKPANGKGGAGIIVADKTDDCYYYNDKKVDYDFISKLHGDYIVEEQVLQSEFLNRIYPHSVNTLRVVTCRYSDGSIDIVGITLRMGVNGRQVDNGSQGGLLIGIDPNTGMPLRSYAGYEYGDEKVFNHPDTGFSFNDLLIPNWSDIKDNLLLNAQKLVTCNLVGWDIAITDEGPLVIEANLKFGIDHTQSGVGGIKKHFIDM